MVAPYKARNAAMLAAVDANHAESVTATPMLAATQYGSPVPDPGRAAFDMVGVLRVPGADGSSGFDRPAQERDRVRVPVGVPTFRVDPDRYPAALTLKAGDVLTATDRGGDRYRITAIDPRMIARRVFKLEMLT
jgi:hypothetical protein